MKTIELEMFWERMGRWEFKVGPFGTEYWCWQGFMEYVYVPDVTKMFLLVSGQRPSHNNYFQLGKGGNVTWEVSDMPNEPPNEPSPWGYGVDKLLNRKFKNKSTLYAWFEYE
jgi:hypothetical protein